MKNILIYLMTILAWGSAWIGIKLQLGAVDPMISVGIGFLLGINLLIIRRKIQGQSIRKKGKMILTTKEPTIEQINKLVANRP